MKKIKKQMAEAILTMIEDIKEDTAYTADENKTNAEAVKILTEAMKNLR